MEYIQVKALTFTHYECGTQFHSARPAQNNSLFTKAEFLCYTNGQDFYSPTLGIVGYFN